MKQKTNKISKLLIAKISQNWIGFSIEIYFNTNSSFQIQRIEIFYFKNCLNHLLQELARFLKSKLF